MKKLIWLIIFTLTLQAAYTQEPTTAMKKSTVPAADTKAFRDAADRNNNFYDNEETFTLPLKDLVVDGEVENPGKVDFSKLTKHSVIVKEALLNKDTGNQFVGAYRYDGYSLFDILRDRILKKKNKAEFNPIIDVYVEIENDLGEKVVMTWGEIYYPNLLHNSIIATEVMRIVPSKTKDLWPLPTTSKLVVASDLIAERNIRNPVRITVMSYPRKYTVNRDISPLYAETVRVFMNEDQVEEMKTLPASLQTETLHTIFYGKGRGIHSTQPFSGVYLKEYLAGKIKFNRKNLRGGLVVLAGIDGYRSVFSFSEIMNRSDQAEVLIVPCADEKDGGKFRIFPSCDFFSDRAVKALSEIRFETGGQADKRTGGQSDK
ncbi:MAG: hypothetical protein NT040_14875 [Bacteroidetes bacterium]|nr:hypothetical protein [Bacteroidota bacterium]